MRLLNGGNQGETLQSNSKNSKETLTSSVCVCVRGIKVSNLSKLRWSPDGQDQEDEPFSNSQVIAWIRSLPAALYVRILRVVKSSARALPLAIISPF